MALNPRSAAVIPVVAGYVAGTEKRTSARKPLHLVSAFILGMMAADALLGVLFAYIGHRVSMVFGPRWEPVIGVMLIILGARWLGLLRFRTFGIKLPDKTAENGWAKTTFGAFLLGIPFSMSFCPFCIPYLLTILTVAAATGNIWYSAVLMVFFSLGRGLPLLITGVSVGALKHSHILRRYVPAFEKAGGVLMVLMGVYYLYNFSRYFTVL